MFSDNQTFWILEDDASCQFVYRQILGIRYDLRFFSSIDELSSCLKVSENLPKLIIADLMLEDGCFLHFLSSSSKEVLSVPFIVVSSIDDLDALRFCFEEGALDYLVKPFQKAELVVKLERIMKGIEQTTHQKSTFPELTLKEQQILSLFLRAKDQTVSRNDVISELWKNVQVHPKTLDVHLYNLRRKIQARGLDIRSSGPQKWILLGNRMDH